MNTNVIPFTHALDQQNAIIISNGAHRAAVVWIFTELWAVLVLSNSLFPYLLNPDVSQIQFQWYAKKACDVRGERIDARRVTI